MLKPSVHGATALLFAVALIVAGCGGDGESPETRAASNLPVILITLDGFGAERLAAFGGEQAAPAIERLVENGVAWTDGWTVCPMSRPAVATYLTGVAPDRHGVRGDLFSPLGEEWQTLASALSAHGYPTAAFPDSSFLGSASGLLRGFDVVDNPPPVPFGPDRWIPSIRDSGDTAEHFGLWVKDLPADSGYFAWLHFSGMMRAQFVRSDGRSAQDGPAIERLKKAKEAKGEAPESDSEPGTDELGEGVSAEELLAPIKDIDAAIGEILSALEIRGDLDQALVLIAGTSATLSGKSTGGGRGPGFSLDEIAIRVPVIARFPTGAGSPRDGAQAVWAPDIPATIAQLTGIELAGESEGVSLLEPVADDRALFAWSWATQDQLGWVPMRAVRRAGWKRIEGWGESTFMLDGSDVEADPATIESLVELLGSRGNPEPDRFDPSVLDAWAREHGLEFRPVPVAGREFGTEETRRKATRMLWRGRSQFLIHRTVPALRAFSKALESDPENLGALLDQGQLYALAQKEEAVSAMRKVVELYPYNTEAWHWLAHAVWQEDSWQAAEPVIQAILPHHLYDRDLLYDLACIKSLGGDLEPSAEFLDRAIRAGYTRWEHIETDPDLRNLRESPHFSAVLRNHGR